MSNPVPLSSQPADVLQNRLLDLGEKLNQLRWAFLSAPIALCLVDQGLRYVEVNERMALLNRRPIEAHIGRTIREVVPDIADVIEPVYLQVFATGSPVESRPVSDSTENGERFLLVNYNPVKSEAGATVLVSVAVFDVTSEKKARDNAHLSAQQLRDVLESTSDNVILLSADWRINYVNGHATRLLAPRILTPGTSLTELFPGWERTEAGQKLMIINTARRSETFETFSSGLNRWLELDVFPTADGLSLFFRDVSDRRRAAEDERRIQAKIAYMAAHDGLTGLRNRSTFYDDVDRLLPKEAADAEVVLFYLDLDGFKAVNDTMGHPAGDAVLVAVSERLRTSVASPMTISRYGGDEFLIAKLAPASHQDICVIAERLIAELSAHYDVEGQHVSIGVSIGIAVAKPGISSSELVRQADVALYAAKTSGRGRYCFFRSDMKDALSMGQSRRREGTQTLPQNLPVQLP